MTIISNVPSSSTSLSEPIRGFYHSYDPYQVHKVCVKVGSNNSRPAESFPLIAERNTPIIAIALRIFFQAPRHQRGEFHVLENAGSIIPNHYLKFKLSQCFFTFGGRPMGYLEPLCIDSCAHFPTMQMYKFNLEDPTSLDLIDGYLEDFCFDPNNLLSFQKEKHSTLLAAVDSIPKEQDLWKRRVLLRSALELVPHTCALYRLWIQQMSDRLTKLGGLPKVLYTLILEYFSDRMIAARFIELGINTGKYCKEPTPTPDESYSDIVSDFAISIINDRLAISIREQMRQLKLNNIDARIQMLATPSLSPEVEPTSSSSSSTSEFFDPIETSTPLKFFQSVEIPIASTNVPELPSSLMPLAPPLQTPQAEVIAPNEPPSQPSSTLPILPPTTPQSLEPAVTPLIPPSIDLNSAPLPSTSQVDGVRVDAITEVATPILSVTLQPSPSSTPPSKTEQNENPSEIPITTSNPPSPPEVSLGTTNTMNPPPVESPRSVTEIKNPSLLRQRIMQVALVIVVLVGVSLSFWVSLVYLLPSTAIALLLAGRLVYIRCKAPKV